jgi:hypothetical protein
MTGHDERRLPPLPFRPRPGPGQIADDYIRGLAAANHLRYSYLRRYLGARSYGAIDPARLAALTGRDLPAIPRHCPSLARSSGSPARCYTPEGIQRNHDAKREKYAAIRRDAENGMSERAIERNHHVGCRTIVKALASADPPERKKTYSTWIGAVTIQRSPAAPLSVG